MIALDEQDRIAFTYEGDRKRGTVLEVLGNSVVKVLVEKEKDYYLIHQHAVFRIRKLVRKKKGEKRGPRAIWVNMGVSPHNGRRHYYAGFKKERVLANAKLQPWDEVAVKFLEVVK